MTPEYAAVLNDFNRLQDELYTACIDDRQEKTFVQIHPNSGHMRRQRGNNRFIH